MGVWWNGKNRLPRQKGHFESELAVANFKASLSPSFQTRRLLVPWPGQNQEQAGASRSSFTPQCYFLSVPRVEEKYPAGSVRDSLLLAEAGI
jgi:hypothetical protein